MNVNHSDVLQPNPNCLLFYCNSSNSVNAEAMFYYYLGMFCTPKLEMHPFEVKRGLF
jgi:hypothetical protein